MFTVDSAHDPTANPVSCLELDQVKGFFQLFVHEIIGEPEGQTFQGIAGRKRTSGKENTILFMKYVESKRLKPLIPLKAYGHNYKNGRSPASIPQDLGRFFR